jgi:hypothetical protein
MRYNAAVFREDYIVRLIAQASAALAKILGLKDTGHYADALAEVDAAYQHFVGLNQGLVTALPAAELVELARWGELLDIGKLVVLGDLLQAEGGVHAAQGQAAAAVDCYLKAMELLLEVAATGEHNLRAVGPRLASLDAQLAGGSIPPDQRAWLDHTLSEWAALPELPAE